jgi:tRNA modification GTPase
MLKDALAKANQAAEFMAQRDSFDLVNIALKNALDCLARLSGEVLSQEILEEIFSNFCIGK